MDLIDELIRAERTIKDLERELAHSQPQKRLNEALDFRHELLKQLANDSEFLEKALAAVRIGWPGADVSARVVHGYDTEDHIVISAILSEPILDTVDNFYDRLVRARAALHQAAPGIGLPQVHDSIVHHSSYSTTALHSSVLTRAVKLTLKHLTDRKRRQIAALLESYRAAVNFFLPRVWYDPDFTFSTANSETLERTRLTTRYRDQALKQAFDIAKATRESAKELGVKASCPFFQGGAKLSDKFVEVEPGRKSFDLVLKLSPLSGRKGKPKLVLPTRRTKVLKKWLRQPGATLVQGCDLSEDRLTVWVSFPEPAKPEVTEDDVLGADAGVYKLLATSEGEFLGTEFRQLRDKIKRLKPGSKAMHRALSERDQLFCRVVKQLPWDRFKAFGFEDLTGIKKGKKKGRSKRFRKSLKSWLGTKLRKLIELACEVKGKWAVPVDPRNSSRECPACSYTDKKNRNGNEFFCLQCGFYTDADYSASLVVKKRAFEKLPEVKKQFEEALLKAAEAALKKARRIAALAKKNKERAAKRRATESNSNPCQSVSAGALRATDNSFDQSRALVEVVSACTATREDSKCGVTGNENPEGEYCSTGLRPQARLSTYGRLETSEQVRYDLGDNSQESFSSVPEVGKGDPRLSDG